MHDAYMIGIPTFVILAGIFFNQVTSREISKQIADLRMEMFREFKEFYRTLGQHDADIEHLKEKK